MSAPSAQPAAELDRLRREVEEKTLLVQAIRKDLIHAQISILELNDSLLQKETDRFDALSLLGQLEHALEHKVNYIMDLDRALNARIAEVQQQLAAAEASAARTIADLVGRLDAANRELGSIHTLAAGYARDLAGARDELQRTAAQRDASIRDLAATREQLAAAVAEIGALRASLSWRLTRPFRALRRLFP